MVISFTDFKRSKWMSLALKNYDYETVEVGFHLMDEDTQKALETRCIMFRLALGKGEYQGGMFND
jgi:hypothetical protein